MRIPIDLVIAQWVLLFTVGALVVVMYRQLGRALHRPRDRQELGPPVGAKAASFTYRQVPGGDLGRVSPGEASQIVLLGFVDPTCPSCERLVDALGKEKDAGELERSRILLLVSDPLPYLQISAIFQRSTLDIGQLTDEVTIDAYKATATPLLVAIDATGVVRAAGTAVDASQVRAFYRECLEPTPKRVSDGALLVSQYPEHVTSTGRPLAGPTEEAAP